MNMQLSLTSGYLMGFVIGIYFNIGINLMVKTDPLLLIWNLIGFLKVRFRDKKETVDCNKHCVVGDGIGFCLFVYRTQTNYIL